ncbi:MAG: hypothetical protein HY953_01270, partial [Candidatus Rokubacteria bacterium]|nr:hypothetical protein [Candidatus Rokubacteria bacterium]
EIDACVEETGDEHGRYLVQDHHWEAPYLADTTLADDLDALAAKLRPLVPKVLAQDLAPDFDVVATLIGLDGEVGAGLPEGYDSLLEGDPCVLGPELTSVVLEWELGLARRKKRDVFSVVERIRELEFHLDNFALDGKAISDFVLALPDGDQQDVLRALESRRGKSPWKDLLADSRGSWFRLLLQLAERWNKEQHAARSSSHIDEDWTLALPLLRGLVRRKAFDEALALATRAVRAMGGRSGRGQWDPRATLLVHDDRLTFRGSVDRTLKGLLELWRKAAEGAGQHDLARVLDLQATALAQAEDGDAMLAAFGKLDGPALGGAREALFADWRRYVAGITLGAWRDPERIPGGQWVTALVDAARAGEPGIPALHETVRKVLAQGARHAPARRRPDAWQMITDSMEGPLPSIARLTRDLDADGSFKRTWPALVRVLPGGPGEDSRKLDATR